MKVTEKWIKAIPESSAHGSGTYEKRLWRLVSDFVRIRDWYKYGGRCVATGVYIPNWKEGQAGHYKSYNVCDGMFKFDEMNIHLQSASSNGWGGQEVGFGFGKELIRRYGKGYLEKINNENRKHVSEKRSKDVVIKKMIDILCKMESLEEKPEYYSRVISLMKDENSNKKNI